MRRLEHGILTRAAVLLDREPGSFATRGYRVDRGTLAIIGAGFLLAICYISLYLGYPGLPGNMAAHPTGWWTWFDQSMTLRSTQALVHGNLDPSQHHYPLGYSILGAVFYRTMPNHAFFFVDLLALLGAFAGFVALARRLLLPGWAGAAVFVLGTLGDKFVFRQWVIPWNTTPVAAFMWLLLAAAAAWVDGRRWPFRIGLLTGAIIACRPSDLLCALPCLATLLWADRGLWRERPGTCLRAWMWLGAGAALIVLPIVALHLAIYGPNESLYMINSARIGFTLADFGWKAYVLLVDPYPWFADGVGILQHDHWIALGLAGLLPALVCGPKTRMLAAVLIVHGVLYISYVDLLPTGLWRFLNIHYFAWAYPGYALLAVLLVRALVFPPTGRRWMRWVGWGSVAATFLVLCLRVVAVPVGEDQPAKAVDFKGTMPPFTDTYLDGRMALQASSGILHDYHDIRVFLYPGGVRVVAMRGDMVGPLAWLPGHAPKGFEDTKPAGRWAPALRLAWPPRWLEPPRKPGIPLPEG